jgi:hypothetical protein
MNIRFMQSGGFAGLLKGCEIDTTTLPAGEAKELEKLVKASGISASGTFLSNSSRDLFEYEITIKDEGSEISATFDDESLPQSAKPLIGYLKKCATPKSPNQ